jgi:hypothetical protein
MRVMQQQSDGSTSSLGLQPDNASATHNNRKNKGTTRTRRAQLSSSNGSTNPNIITNRSRGTNSLSTLCPTDPLLILSSTSSLLIHRFTGKQPCHLDPTTLHRHHPSTPPTTNPLRRSTIAPSDHRPHHHLCMPQQ